MTKKTRKRGCYILHYEYPAIHCFKGMEDVREWVKGEQLRPKKTGNGTKRKRRDEIKQRTDDAENTDKPKHKKRKRRETA